MKCGGKIWLRTNVELDTRQTLGLLSFRGSPIYNVTKRLASNIGNAGKLRGGLDTGLQPRKSSIPCSPLYIVNFGSMIIILLDQTSLLASG